MIISIFTCPTEGCIYNLEPARITDAINPVMCGACFAYANAVETEEEINYG
jgi:hypothetical protein